MNATTEIAVCEAAVRANSPLHKNRPVARYFGDLSGALTTTPAPVHRDQTYWDKLGNQFLKGMK